MVKDELQYLFLHNFLMVFPWNSFLMFLISKFDLYMQIHLLFQKLLSIKKLYKLCEKSGEKKATEMMIEIPYSRLRIIIYALLWHKHFSIVVTWADSFFV